MADQKQQEKKTLTLDEGRISEFVEDSKSVLPSPMKQVTDTLCDVTKGGSVIQMRRIVARLIDEMEIPDALKFKDDLLRLRSAAEAAAQSGVEAYASRQLKG
jgi:hypothetical protein